MILEEFRASFALVVGCYGAFDEQLSKVLIYGVSFDRDGSSVD
jgi:hypothetical protein